MNARTRAHTRVACTQTKKKDLGMMSSLIRELLETTPSSLRGCLKSRSTEMQEAPRSTLPTEKHIIIEQGPAHVLNHNYTCICMCILKKVRTEPDHSETILSGTGARTGTGRVKGLRW